MEPPRNEPHAGASAELIAALALGLAASWRPAREQLTELRAAADPTHAASARRHLAALRTPDPQTATRAMELLDAAFPTVTGAGHTPAGGAPVHGPPVRV